MMKNIYSSQLKTTRPIGELVYNNLNFLKRYIKTKSDRKRKRLLRLATANELFSIIETATNILRARFHLTQRQRLRLTPHLNYIRKLSRARTARGAKKIVQKGGSLALVSLLTPVVIEALKLISR
jgi:hypothetical protein